MSPGAPHPAELLRVAGETASVFARRMGGEYREDEWGFDEEYAETAFPLLEFLYERWWRVQVSGIENVPSHGRALMAANHAGSLFPFDALMIATAVIEEHPLPRWPRALIADWIFGAPFAGLFLRKVGGVPSNPSNAIRLLEQDQLVMSFPEGEQGSGKPFSQRYRLARFGRGGFVEMAIRTGSPLIPVAVVGAEEIYPKLADSETIARMADIPFFPVTPTFPWLGALGAVPLPSRWRIQFCEPIDVSGHGPDAAEDKALLFDISERIRERVQEAVYENLVARGSAFL